MYTYVYRVSYLRAETGISSTSLILLEKFSDKSWIVLRAALIDVINIFVDERVEDTYRSAMSFLSRITFLYALIDASRYYKVIKLGQEIFTIGVVLFCKHNLLKYLLN